MPFSDNFRLSARTLRTTDESGRCFERAPEKEAGLTDLVRSMTGWPRSLTVRIGLATRDDGMSLFFEGAPGPLVEHSKLGVPCERGPSGRCPRPTMRRPIERNPIASENSSRGQAILGPLSPCRAQPSPENTDHITSKGSISISEKEDYLLECVADSLEEVMDLHSERVADQAWVTSAIAD